MSQGVSNLQGSKHGSKNIDDLKKQADPTLLVNDTATLRAAYERAKEFYQRWLEQGKWVAQQLQQLETKKELSHDQENPSCPLCEQNLSQARKRFLQKKFVHEESFLTHRLNRLRKLLLDLKKQLEEMHKALSVAATLDTVLLEQIKFTQELQALEDQQRTLLTHLEQQKKKKAEQELSYTQLEQQHTLTKKNDPTLQEIQQTLTALEKQCANQHDIDKQHTDCLEKLALVKKQRAASLSYQEQKKELHEELSTVSSSFKTS